jgi:hypothetical protein
MKGWSGPLVIFGELGALALALVLVLALANMLLWLLTQFWVWLLLGAALLGGAWAYRRYRVGWWDGTTIYPCWRWELPQPSTEGSAPQEPRRLLVLGAVRPSYCDQCGTLLINGGCPYCDGDGAARQRWKGVW